MRYHAWLYKPIVTWAKTSEISIFLLLLLSADLFPATPRLVLKTKFISFLTLLSSKWSFYYCYLFFRVCILPYCQRFLAMEDCVYGMDFDSKGICLKHSEMKRAIPPIHLLILYFYVWREGLIRVNTCVIGLLSDSEWKKLSPPFKPRESNSLYSLLGITLIIVAISMRWTYSLTTLHIHRERKLLKVNAQILRYLVKTCVLIYYYIDFSCTRIFLLLIYD